MARLINEEIYLDKAQNGARILFDIETYRVLDGTKFNTVLGDYVFDGIDSYFLINFNNDEYYELTLKECFDLVACKMVGVNEDIILEQIEELIAEVSVRDIIEYKSEK